LEADLVGQPFNEQYSCVNCIDHDDICIGVETLLGCFVAPTLFIPGSPSGNDVGTHGLFRDSVKQTGIGTPGSA
jgi:hypothetical protein